MIGLDGFVLMIGLMLALLLGGMWIPFALGLAGVVAIWLSSGTNAMLAVGLVSWSSTNSFTLTSVPMFILMAEILQKSGATTRFYDGLTKVVRGLPGGLMQTNIVGCAFFAAISGSSVATAASIGTAALPQLARRGYDRPMAAGSLAAGGTLGILIPPSIPMIIYGTLTETSIAKLFMAGVIPGILLTLFFMAFIAFAALRRPGVAPADPEPIPFGVKLRAIGDLLPMIVLMSVVLGSLYAGVATPTESAGLGCAISLVVAMFWGNLTWRAIRAALTATVRTSCTIMLIVVMAYVFSYGVETTNVGENLTKWLVGLGLSKTEFMLVLIVLYSILGCLIDSLGMIVLTVPLLFEPIRAYGFDPIWFGVMLVLLLEFGQITPPVGINLFVVQSISGWRLGEVVRGSVPYWTIMLCFMGLLMAVPQMALWLPAQMFR